MRKLGFDRVSDNYKVNMKEHSIGIGCCVSLGSGGPHVFIMAPDEADLEKALTELQITPEEKSRNNALAVVYPAEHLPLEIAKQSFTADLIWVYHSESDVVFVSDRSVLLSGQVSEIGPAVELTNIEAKRLLVGCGWSREDVREVNIKSEEEV